MSDLKLCPFCGSNPKIINLGIGTKGQIVGCDCGAHMSAYATENYKEPEIHAELGRKAVEQWNTRPELIEDIIVGYEEIREIYAGMDGFIAETAPEGYQQRIIKQMYDVAIKNIELLKSKP